MKVRYWREETEADEFYEDYPEPGYNKCREIVLELWGHVQYDGPALDVVAENEDWDVALYTVGEDI